MESGLEGYRKEESILTKYIKQIEVLMAGNKKEELEKLLNNVINLLPENVKSISIPVTSSNGEIEFVTKERESIAPKEEQEDWNMGDLIIYSIKEEGLTNKNENYR
jgi:hypothetical protein